MKKFSKKWMQTFVEGEFPKDDNLILTQVSKKGFEVEGFEKGQDGDTLFEIKVLPNRIADAFSVRGMAREFAAVLNLKWGGYIATPELSSFINNQEHLILQGFPDARHRENPVYIFTGVKVTGFDNTVETPEWIKDIIVKSGGRSINCLVDITNLMLFSFGQPAHVFDFDKMTGKVVLRFARAGEELELLDGKKITLTEEDFVIADEARALSLAGIKGGKYAETTKDTKVCLFEMANFNPTMIRKTSTRLQNRTDASKIFENGITTAKTEEALALLLATIAELQPNAVVEFIINKKIEDKTAKWVETSFSQIENSTGVKIGKEKIIELLKLQNFQVEESGETLKVLGSSERLDINIPEDVAEEVMRLYGFDNIPNSPLNLAPVKNHDKIFLIENYLRVRLFEKGYTEIMTYVFVNEGEVKLKAGLAEDKMYLRKNLEEGMKTAFTKNYNYLPVLETEVIKSFEMGSVFGQKGEFKNCVITFDDNKKKTKYLENILGDINEIIEEIKLSRLNILNRNEKAALVEFSLNDLAQEADENNLEIPFLELNKDLQSINYKPLSVYPFISRDVAVWTPGGDWENDEKLQSNFSSLKTDIENLKLENFEKIYLFDKFSKKMEDGSTKTSIAFRIIFQSYDKTLTDIEVETEMDKVKKYLNQKAFEMR